jgi:hypothetical protein
VLLGELGEGGRDGGRGRGREVGRKGSRGGGHEGVADVQVGSVREEEEDQGPRRKRDASSTHRPREIQ